MRHNSDGTCSCQLATAFVPKLLLAKKNFELLALALSLQHDGDIFDKTAWFLKILKFVM